MRKLRWNAELPIPKRPYRDSAIFYGVLAAIVVGVALVTGGSLPKALVIAGGFFVVATAWSWWRWKVKLEQRGKR